MIVILTALGLEYDAVRANLTGLSTHTHSAGTIFEVGTVAGHPDRRVALAVIGKGNNAAATITERAIAEFSPGALLFVGVAGALEDWLVIGDVVVATKVYAYHGGLSGSDGFRARPKAWDAPHHMEQTARRLARSAAWRAGLPDGGEPPQVHFEPIAAGDVVLDAKDSPVAGHLRTHYDDAVAIETESGGVANAGQLNHATPTMTIRAISDHADGRKADADRSGSQTVAARNAAAFAAALVASLDEARGGGVDHDERPERSEHPYVRNVATGNARVVMQAGTIHGGVQFGHGTPGLSGTGEQA